MNVAILYKNNHQTFPSDERQKYYIWSIPKYYILCFCQWNEIAVAVNAAKFTMK